MKDLRGWAIVFFTRHRRTSTVFQCSMFVRATRTWIARKRCERTRSCLMYMYDSECGSDRHSSCLGSSTNKQNVSNERWEHKIQYFQLVWSGGGAQWAQSIIFFWIDFFSFNYPFRFHCTEPLKASPIQIGKRPSCYLFLASNWRWHVILSLELMPNNHFVLIQLIGEWCTECLRPTIPSGSQWNGRGGKKLRERRERKREKNIISIKYTRRESRERILMVRSFIIFNDCEKRLATTEPNRRRNA